MAPLCVILTRVPRPSPLPSMKHWKPSPRFLEARQARQAELIMAQLRIAPEDEDSGKLGAEPDKARRDADTE